MQEFRRTVICDCCGFEVKDLFGGYVTKRIGGRLYDLCELCEVALELDIERAEKEIVEKAMKFKEGRPVEDE